MICKGIGLDKFYCATKAGDIIFIITIKDQFFHITKKYVVKFLTNFRRFINDSLSVHNSIM